MAVKLKNLIKLNTYVLCMAFFLGSVPLLAAEQDGAVLADTTATSGGGTEGDRDSDNQALTKVDTGLMYHLKWYAVDYAAVAVALAANAALLPLIEPGPALYGPQFDDAKPDFSILNAPENARFVGAPYLGDTVPSSWIYAAGISLAASSLVYDGVVHQDLHRAHNLALGGVEAVLMTYTLTSLLKLSVGRLRPNFRDRATRYYCNPDGGNQRDLPGMDCSQVDADGAYLDAHEFQSGHRSFPSGHSSSSFALATYFALYLGGEMVWGDHATQGSVPLGAAMMAGLMGLATTVGATRVSDGQHHIDDVAAGAALGMASSALFYFLHFNTRGQAIYRGLTVIPTTTPRNDGMMLSLAFPML